MASRQPAKTINKLKVFKCRTITNNLVTFVSLYKKKTIQTVKTLLKKAFFVEIKENMYLGKLLCAAHPLWWLKSSLCVDDNVKKL